MGKYLDETGLAHFWGNLLSFGDGYYDSISVTTGVYTVDSFSSTYYLVEIPYTDSHGDVIPIEADYMATETPLEYAQDERTTLTANSGFGVQGGKGAVIKNGVVVHDADYSDLSTISYLRYVGFDADRGVHEYPVTATTSEMLGDGIQNACIAYYRLVTNGVVEDVSDIGLATRHFLPNPRNSIFISASNSICFLACDGRTNVDYGLTPSQFGDFMVSLGAVDGWMLDGGGSSHISIKGTKINKNFDDGGTSDRYVGVAWSVPHRRDLQGIQKAFSNVGFMKQLYNEQLVDMFTRDAVYYGDSLSLLESFTYSGVYYVTHVTDAPSDTDNGYVIVMVRSGHSTQKIEMWIPYNTGELWFNTCYDSAWSGWCRVDSGQAYSVAESIPSETDIDTITSVGRYVVISTASAGTMTNLPVIAGGSLVVKAMNNASVITQEFRAANKTLITYARRGVKSGGVWTFDSWQLVPSVSEKSISVASLDASGNVSIGLDSSDVVLSANADGFILLPFTNGGSWYCKVLDYSTGTVASEGSTLTVTIRYAATSV